jgi:hypothetical protein
MPQVQIDRLGLEVPGLTATEGRRLADLVVEGLGGVQWPDKVRENSQNLTINVDAGAGKLALEEMAVAIVREILRQIA